jgi:hypothetical protein
MSVSMLAVGGSGVAVGGSSIAVGVALDGSENPIIFPPVPNSYPIHMSEIATQSTANVPAIHFWRCLFKRGTRIPTASPAKKRMSWKKISRIIHFAVAEKSPADFRLFLSTYPPKSCPVR